MIIPMMNAIQEHYVNVIRCNARRPTQVFLPLLTRRFRHDIDVPGLHCFDKLSAILLLSRLRIFVFWLGPYHSREPMQLMRPVCCTVICQPLDRRFRQTPTEPSLHLPHHHVLNSFAVISTGTDYPVQFFTINQLSID